MAVYTVSNIVGMTVDYTDLQTALTALAALDELKIYGTWTGNYTLTAQQNTLNFIAGSSIIGTGVGYGLSAPSGNMTVVKGLNISNYERLINGDYSGWFFEDCTMSDGGFKSRGYQIKMQNVSLLNVNFEQLNSNGSTRGLRVLDNVTITSCTGVRLLSGASNWVGDYQSIYGSDSYFNRVLIKDSDFTISRGLNNTSYYGYEYNSVYTKCKENIIDNCTFAIADNRASTAIISPYSLVNSIADMQAVSDAYESGMTIQSYLSEFKTVTLDTFNYPTDETSYILNQHIGANRYAESTNLVPNGVIAGWQLVVGDYVYNETTSDTPDPLVVTASLPQARKARRIAIQYERVNNIEQFGANGAIEVSVRLSFDGGVTFGSPVTTVISGIDSATLDFDYLDRPATDFELTIESSGIAGGAGGVRFRGFRVEFYDMDEQITAGTRTLYEQKATNSDGYFIVGLPYKVETTLGDFTAQEIKDNPAANIAFADGEETNIEGFSLDGEIYETFVAEPVEITNVRAVKAGINGSDIEIKNVPCSNFNHKMLKFKNGAGAWEYLLFYARDEEKPSRSSEQYLQFEDGYKNVNGDIQRDYKLYNDEIDIVNKPVLDYLDKNQNAWYANGWQFSSFTTILMLSTAENFPLLTNERLLKADLTQIQFNEVYARFKTGDRVTFVTSDYLIDMYGFVSQMSESDGVYTVYFKFTGATGNDDLVSLDALLGDTDVYIVAYDAWELCAVDNLTVTTTSRSVLNVSLTLKTNPETNYRV